VRKTSGPVLFVLALAAVGAVAVLTAGAVALFDDDDTAAPATTATTTATTAAAALAPDQVAVTGAAVNVTVDGVRFPAIPTPVVITTPQAGLGAGGVIQAVTISGQPAIINWDAGRPFDLRGEGRALTPSVANVTLGPAVLRVGFPDDTGVALDPGAYTLATPVAVSFDEGLASSRDSVAFDADAESVAAFRGGAFTDLAPHDLTLSGPGHVVVEGQLTVRRPDGSSAPAARVELVDGPFELTAVPAPDGSGWTVDVLLQGEVTVA